MTDVPVVIIPPTEDETVDVAAIVAEAVAPFADAIEELGETLTAATQNDGEVDEVTERLVTVEHDVTEVRDQLNDVVTRSDLDNYMAGMIELAAATATAAAEDVIDGLVQPDVLDDEPVIIADDATVVIPDATDAGAEGRKRGLFGRIADAW